MNRKINTRSEDQCFTNAESALVGMPNVEFDFSLHVYKPKGLELTEPMLKEMPKTDL